MKSVRASLDPETKARKMYVKYGICRGTKDYNLDDDDNKNIIKMFEQCSTKLPSFKKSTY